jgi:hypothetical protein
MISSFWESPLGLYTGSREGASFVAEKLALQQGPGDRGAVQLYKWALPARTLVVNGAGDDLLAGAGFALNQSHRIAFCDHADQTQDLLKRRTEANDLLVPEGA